MKDDQCCLHKSQVVHERGKRNQTKMACYRYFPGKGQKVAKSNNIGVFWWLKQVQMSGSYTSLVTDFCASPSEMS